MNEEDYEDPYPIKPKIRADCGEIARPCPYVGCKYHLYLSLTKRGSIKVISKSDISVDEALLSMAETCALDAAEKNRGMTLEEIGQIMEVSRERVRQIEVAALGKIKKLAEQVGVSDYDQMVIWFFDLLDNTQQQKDTT